MFDIRPIN